MASSAIMASSAFPSYSDTLLDVRRLGVSFDTDEGLVRAVDGVDFSVRRSRTLGIVGESGSGKSVSTQAMVRLLPRNAILDPETSILLRREGGESVEVTDLDPRGQEIHRVRGGDIAMIFQEPMSSFSPVYTIGNQIMEAILAHRDVTRREAREIAIDLLDRVGISNPAGRVDQYPFELSGGMRQRAMIAVALSSRPSLLIADEPTTSLDVTVQAQILELLADLQEQFGMAIIFITHDLGVIAQVADEISVMYLGRIMEHGTARDVIVEPLHPYTQRLLQAIPRLDRLGERLRSVGGDIPSPLERPTGCPFSTRCASMIPGKCDRHSPARCHVSETHSVSCFLYDVDEEAK